MPQTRLEPGSVCFIGKLEGVAEGTANRTGPRVVTVGVIWVPLTCGRGVHTLA